MLCLFGLANPGQGSDPWPRLVNGSSRESSNNQSVMREKGKEAVLCDNARKVFSLSVTQGERHACVQPSER